MHTYINVWFKIVAQLTVDTFKMDMLATVSTRDSDHYSWNPKNHPEMRV